MISEFRFSVFNFTCVWAGPLAWSVAPKQHRGQPGM